MEWDFGDILLTMLAFFFWFIFIWMFIGVFSDIFRRSDISGWGKGGWIFMICVLPFLGVLIYMISRPVSQQDVQMFEAARRGAAPAAANSTADEIAKLAKLHEGGALSDNEFASLKAKAMA